MSLKSVQYHTPSLSRKFIYSNWLFLGFIPAVYAKYAISFIVFVIALVAQFVLHYYLQKTFFLFFFIVVFTSAVLNGIRGAVFFTFLCAGIVDFYFIPPYHSFVVNGNPYVVILLTFIIECLLISVFIDYCLKLLLRLRRQADLLNLTREGAIVVDVKTNEILYWSSGAKELYGYTYHETQGKNIQTLLNTKFLTPLGEIEKKLYKNSEWEGELVHTKQNGKQVIVNSRWILQKNEENIQDVYIQLNMDITKQKTLEKRKDEFLSIASHELKTPVTSIKAFTQILEARFRKQGDTNSALYLSKMNTQINRLTNLVNDLLDTTKIQAGKLQLNIETFRLEDLVDEVIENMQMTTTKHIITKQGSSREMVWADRNRTEQVLINLISNAIKYSPRSDLVIVHIYEEDGWLKIAVEDRGIGIPADKINNIFTRFYRVESKEGEFRGLGLGLYISAELIKRLGGKMWVESQEKIGSIFYFTLPTEKINIDSL